jgi:hypothetical protein
MTATRTLATRKPTVHRDHGRPAPPRAPQPAQIDVSIHRLDQIAVHASSQQRASALLDAALGEPVQSLPYAAVLERRFGQPLDWIRSRCGGLVTVALDELGAQAATRGADVFLRDRAAPVEVVAHEVTHAIQSRIGGNGPAGVVAEHAPQEAEASWALRAPVRPAEGLAPGAIALLRQGPSLSEEPTITVEPPSAPVSDALLIAAPEPGAAATPPAPSAREVAPPAFRPSPGGGTVTSPEAPAPQPPSEAAAPAEEPISREAAVAEAKPTAPSAKSAAEVLHAYAEAPPTVKAQEAASLSAQLDEVLPTETQDWQAAVPPIDATLTGSEGPPPQPLRIEKPAPAPVTSLEPETIAPAPEPEIPEAPELAPFIANDRIGGTLARLTEPPPERLAGAIGDTLSQIQTNDPSVPRTPGPPPAIALGGETDPARIAGQQQTGNTQAAEARDAAMRGVIEGPGPEQVQLAPIQESYAIEPVAAAAPVALVPPEGPGSYLALGLPPEVQVTFDEQQQAAMAESMAAATSKADEATAARDAARDEAVSTAQQGAAQLNQQAQADQTAAVAEARTVIQTERQSTLKAQNAEVERVRGDAEARRQTDEANIDTRVQTEQQAVDDTYAKGESDIAGKVADGERQANAERDQAERDAESQSWADLAVSFVRDAFNALVAEIGKIFDAVRAAVNAVLDDLKKFALQAIDRVAGFVKDAIAAYGEFLKFAINSLIGTVFPELAAALNAAIDTAVAAAQAAVDGVADRLKAGVSAFVDGLRAGINAALDAYQGAISFAVSLVGAALTGDWGMVARKVLEAVLKLIGVDPAAFYAFVGRAQETFEIIVNDPLGFLSNLVSALVGGVQGFADRFGDHLKKGIIGWLTGTLGGAGITLPEKLDLMGVLDIARQILGLTWERLRAKAVKLIGEKNVARLEFVGGYITTLINEGWSGLWNKIMADLSGLLDMVFDGIKSFLVERVVMAMIKKIPALFGPVGAIVQLVMTIWNLYEFLRDQLSRIAALIKTVVDSIGDIARGILTAAIAKVEEVLGNLLPLAIDLLARILGLGNLGEDVRKVIEKVQTFIDKAIDGLITRVIGLFTGKGKGATPGAPDSTGSTTGPDLTRNFTMSGQSHTLRATMSGGRLVVTIASVKPGDLIDQAERTREAEQAAHNSAAVSDLADFVAHFQDSIEEIEKSEQLAESKERAMDQLLREMAATLVEIGSRHHLRDLSSYAAIGLPEVELNRLVYEAINVARESLLLGRARVSEAPMAGEDLQNTFDRVIRAANARYDAACKARLPRGADVATFTGNVFDFAGNDYFVDHGNNYIAPASLVRARRSVDNKIYVADPVELLEQFAWNKSTQTSGQFGKFAEIAARGGTIEPRPGAFFLAAMLAEARRNPNAHVTNLLLMAEGSMRKFRSDAPMTRGGTDPKSGRPDPTLATVPGTRQQPPSEVTDREVALVRQRYEQHQNNTLPEMVGAFGVPNIRDNLIHFLGHSARLAG